MKHHKLARSLRSGGNARELKPTSSGRDALNTIISYPPTTVLTIEEQDMIWKFRYYLSSQKKALTKFVKCVNWKVPGEERQALDMLNLWAPPDPEDALELLGPAFTHPAVRRYAITRLNHALDDDLMLYLLQLVQALKYENFESIKAASEVFGKNKDIIDKNEKSEKGLIGNNLSLSTSITTVGVWLVFNFLTSKYYHVINLLLLLFQSSEPKSDHFLLNQYVQTDLASFLITRACQNSTLANYLYWYLSIECEDQPDTVTPAKRNTGVREMYITVMKMFTNALSAGNAIWQKRRQFLARQKIFVDQLVSLVKAVARESGNRKKKTERLRVLLTDADTIFKINFSNFEPIPFPLDPDISIKGIMPEK